MPFLKRSLEEWHDWQIIVFEKNADTHSASTVVHYDTEEERDGDLALLDNYLKVDSTLVRKM